MLQIVLIHITLPSFVLKPIKKFKILHYEILNLNTPTSLENILVVIELLTILVNEYRCLENKSWEKKGLKNIKIWYVWKKKEEKTGRFGVMREKKWSKSWMLKSRVNLRTIWCTFNIRIQHIQKLDHLMHQSNSFMLSFLKLMCSIKLPKMPAYAFFFSLQNQDIHEILLSTSGFFFLFLI